MADQFTVENGLAAQALSTLTTAPIAAEPWTDGSALLYSAADGKLHPVPVEPLAGASLTINTSGGITGGGAVALGGSLSLGLSAVPNAALANSSLTVSAGSGLSGGGAVSLGSSVSLSVDSTAVALLSGAQTFTGQKTFPSAGSSAVVIPALRQTSGGK